VYPAELFAPSAPPTGAERARVKDSFGSYAVSPVTATATVFVVSPGAKVRVPPAAV
jgi:hypothetical protein